MLIIFLFITIGQSQIPKEFKDLANKAIKNSQTKKPKTLREASKPPGYYESPTYHFKLLETITSSFSNDIKGYSIDKSYIALVKRKNYNLNESFVFVDTETDKLYKVSELIATENNVAIHKCEETSIFKIMTNFQLHFRSKSAKINAKNLKNINNPRETISDEYSYNWDIETNLPTYSPIEDTPLEYGFGGAYSFAIDMVFSFNSLRDIKFAGQVEFEGYMGAGIKITDQYTREFPDIELKGKSFPIPNFAFDKDFHLIKIKIGAFLNLKSQLKGLKLTIPVGFEYFKGYKAYAKKYIEITPYTISDSDWIMNIQPLPEINNADKSDITQTIESIKFEGTLNLALSFSFNIEIGDLKKVFEFGINSPIKCTFSFDTKQCLFPYLSAIVDIQFNMFLSIPSIEILSIEIINEDYFQHDLINAHYVSPKFCIGPNAGIEQIKDTIPTPQTITVSDNNFNSYITWKDEETVKYFEATISEKYLNSFFLLLAPGLSPIIEGDSKSLREGASYVKVTESKIKFSLQRGEESTGEYSINFIYLENDEIKLSNFGVVNNYQFKKDLYNAVLLPKIGNQIYVVVKPTPSVINRFIVNENNYFVIFEYNLEDIVLQLTLQYAQINDLEPFLNVDITFAHDFINSENDLNSIDYSVFSNNAKSVIAKQNDVIIGEASVSDKVSDLFQFSFPIDTTGTVTFIPICKDETGKMCQLTYTPDGTGYDIIKYPNRDGISITGSGFLVEAIPVTKNEPIEYYKTYEESIEKIGSYYSTEPIEVVPKYESSKNTDTPNEKRVCLYKSENSKEILPFSRKYFSDHLDDLLEQLNINVQNDDYSGITSDEDGCIVFPSSLLPSGETNIEIKHLVKEVCDIPIVEINKEDPESPSENEPEKPSENEPENPSENEPEKPSENEPEKPSENEPEIPSENEPVKPNKLKYYCICTDQSICTECTKGIQTNEVSTSATISQDPGVDVEIKVYSNVEISSSIFTQEHDVTVDSRFSLNVTNAEKVDLSDTTKLKVDKLSFTSGEYVNIKPKSSELKVTLSTVAAGKDFNVEIPSTLTVPLKLTVSNKENNVIAPTLTIKGNGEVNTYDYPFENIISTEEVKLIKGVSIICKPQENGEKCDQTLYNDYKVLKHFENMANDFDRNSKIYVFLHTFADAYIDVDINRLQNQELCLIKKSSSLLLEDSTKLRVLSTTVLHNNKNNVALEGSTGSTALDNSYVSDLVIGFNDKLTVKQDESYNVRQPKITVQAQNKNSIIVIDESVQFEHHSYLIDSTKDNSEIEVYYGDRDIKEVPSNWQTTDKIAEIQPKPGLPPQGSSKGGGISKGAIIGIVVAVVVVVIAVVAVLVYIFVFRKKRSQSTDEENDERDIDTNI